ncbi:MAG: hypothetical protein P8K77_05080 [Polaribacter sp.]|nr:hypothetical protein [Polaribacter sp.]
MKKLKNKIMKKIFLVVACMLFGTFAFANEIKTPIDNLEKVECVKITISGTPYTITDLNDSRLNEILFDCTVEFDITIWLPGASSPTRLKGKVTVKGKSCIELLKESLK